MKSLCIVLIVIIVICAHVTESKLTRRNHGLKKSTTHLKSTKGTRNIIESFNNLPEADIAFIKELDKQFNKFGGNVKIKVQKENRTISNKNSKRTIDGSLGYGYQKSNDQQGSYSFSKPKLEIYPYSQHDIPPSPEYRQDQHHLHYLRNYPQALVDSDPNYYNKQAGHTSVEVQPSHSYEIKQTENGYKTVYGNQDAEQHEQQHDQPDHSAYNHGGADSGEAVPVIVLRIPGPAKYAQHLQALLQQYLEVRAAEYLQALQEHETQPIHEEAQYNAPLHHHHHHHQQQQAYVAAPMLLQPVHDIQPAEFAALLPHLYQPEHQHISQQQQQQQHQHQHQQHQIETENGHVGSTPEPPSGYYKVVANEEPHSDIVHPSSFEYHNVHVGTDLHHQQVENSNEQIIYGHQQESVSKPDQLLTTENFPGDQHTQVIFKSTTSAPYHETEQDDANIEHGQGQHYLPPPTPTYHAPLSYQNEQHYYDDSSSQHDQSNNEQFDAQMVYDNSQSIEPHLEHSTEEIVPITQRPAVLPHNYHSQLAQLAHYDDVGYDYQPAAPHDNNLHKRSRQSTRDDRYKKFMNVAQRMKSRWTAEYTE